MLAYLTIAKPLLLSTDISFIALLCALKDLNNLPLKSTTCNSPEFVPITIWPVSIAAQLILSFFRKLSKDPYTPKIHKQ